MKQKNRKLRQNLRRKAQKLRELRRREKLRRKRVHVGRICAPGSVKSVLVIGAGVAGLNCARLLKKHGCEVKILEGRDRIGGRLHTDSDGVDCGGHWIHGGGPHEHVEEWEIEHPNELNPTRHLCEKWGIKTKLTDGDSIYTHESEVGLSEIDFYLPDGSLMPQDGEAETELWDVRELIYDKVGELEDKMRANGEDGEHLSVADAINMVKANLDTPLTPRQELFLNWHIITEFQGEQGEDPENLSFWYYDGGKNGDYRVFKGGDRIIEGGYQVFYNRLAESVRDDISLNKIVKSIRRGPAGVKVRCADGSAYTADVCVCTLPLGVLKRPHGDPMHVRFSPPLPRWKREAYNRGKMACLNKFIMFFDKCYWPKDQYAFAYIADIAEQQHYSVQIINMYWSHKMPVLAILIGGKDSRAWESRAEKLNQAWCMQSVRKLFGKDVPDPIKFHQTAWGQDPFCFGSYCCVAPGMKADDLNKYAEPVGKKLFFAGEHTSPSFWGCVHSAVWSGEREAARILGDRSLLPASLVTMSKRDAKKLAIQNALELRRMRKTHFARSKL